MPQDQARAVFGWLSFLQVGRGFVIHTGPCVLSYCQRLVEVAPPAMPAFVMSLLASQSQECKPRASFQEEAEGGEMDVCVSGVSLG